MKILIAQGLFQNEYLLPHIYRQAKDRNTCPDGVLVIDQDEKAGATKLSREDFLLTLQTSLRARVAIMPNRTCQLTIEDFVFLYVKESSIVAVFGELTKIQKLNKKVILISRCTSHLLYRVGIHFECLAAVVILSNTYRSPKLIRIPILQSGSCQSHKLNCLELDNDLVYRFIELPC